jgi:fimbrial chaperone protein
MMVAALVAFGSASAGWAASFSVEPVRIILGEQHRTERLTVKNESDRPLTLLIKAYRWTQTKEGQDLYTENAELIIFPRALTLAAEEERFIRVGITSPSGPQEQAFRIYLEEQPVKDEQEPAGATGRLVMRVGIPVFVQPLTTKPALNVKELSVVKGLLHFTLTNGGNSFVMADQITVNGFDDKGAEVFAKNMGGFYLLTGSERIFEETLPREQCLRVARISVTVRNEGKEQHNMLVMPFGACTD